MKQKRLPFSITLLPEHKQLFQELADERALSLSAWLVQAGLSYARSAKRSKGKNADTEFWPSGWRKSIKCHVCGKMHDPLEAHPEIGKYDDYELTLGQVRQS
jgi:hypothetical protein